MMNIFLSYEKIKTPHFDELINKFISEPRSDRHKVSNKFSTPFNRKIFTTADMLGSSKIITGRNADGKSLPKRSKLATCFDRSKYSISDERRKISVLQEEVAQLKEATEAVKAKRKDGGLKRFEMYHEPNKTLIKKIVLEINKHQEFETLPNSVIATSIENMVLKKRQTFSTIRTIKKYIQEFRIVKPKSGRPTCPTSLVNKFNSWLKENFEHRIDSFFCN